MLPAQHRHKGRLTNTIRDVFPTFKMREHTWRAGVSVPSTSKRQTVLRSLSLKLLDIVINWTFASLYWTALSRRSPRPCVIESRLDSSGILLVSSNNKCSRFIASHGNFWTPWSCEHYVWTNHHHRIMNLLPILILWMALLILERTPVLVHVISAYALLS